MPKVYLRPSQQGIAFFHVSVASGWPVTVSFGVTLVIWAAFVVWNRVEPLFLAECLDLDALIRVKNFQHIVFLRDDEYYSEMRKS